jgi:hypothetical protein
VVGGERGRLPNRNWVGCRKGVLERVVKCLFLVPTRLLSAIVITFMCFAFRIGIHFDFSDRTINRHRSIGWEFVHVCIDDASRVAFVQVLADQRKESPVAYLQAAVAYYAKLGIRIERVPPVLMRTTQIACSRSFAPTMAAALGHRARAIGSDASNDEVPRVATSLSPASG